MSGLLGTGAIDRIHSSLLPWSRPRPLEELSTEELETRLLLNEERLRLAETGGLLGGIAAGYWGVGRLLR